MKREQIMSLIKALAGSQGIYSRLYRSILGLDEAAREELFEHLESLNFGDDLDFILYFEEGIVPEAAYEMAA